MIQFSQSALREIKRLKTKEPFEGGFVRVDVTAGGCSGLIYALSFSRTAHPGDQVFGIESLKVTLSPKALALCEGMTVDYSEDLMGGSFRFINGLAKQTCGCGFSFSLEAAGLADAEDCISGVPS
jgi:iron-sulfur cluster assembly protein